MLRLLSFFFIITSITTSAQKGSKEKIYSSFTVVNDGLEATRALLAKETSRLYFDFIKLKGNDSTAVQLGDSIRLKSDELINYINHVKILLIIKTEKLDKEAVIDGDTIISLKYLNHFDDYYTPGETLLGEDEWNPIKGKYTARDLKNKLKKYNQFIEKECFLSKQYDSFIDLENSGYYGSWEVGNFFEKPLAGIITYLSKLQVDIILMEQASIRHIIQTKSE